MTASNDRNDGVNVQTCNRHLTQVVVVFVSFIGVIPQHKRIRVFFVLF